MTTENSIPTVPAESVSSNQVEQVIRYHIQTKHHLNRYARSLGYLDWSNQPDPFRRYEGAPLIELPLLTPEEEPLSPDYRAIYQKGAVYCQPVSTRAVSRFCELALGLTAWKKAGESEWALRSNPSSGNLHPTEGYFVFPQLPESSFTPGLYHYAPKEHGLEWRAEFSAELLAHLLSPFPPSAFLFGLTSVHWREAWKYGERAFRYCNHDVGHAIGTARFAAATLGWSMVLLDGEEQQLVALLLGTNRIDDFVEAEPEHPDCLAVVWPSENVNPADFGKLSRSASFVKRETAAIPLFVDSAIVHEMVKSIWHGKANRLSREHGVHWDIIDEAAKASWKTTVHKRTIQYKEDQATPHPLPVTPHGVLAGQIIRQRRSAVAFDGKTSVSAAMFFGMLQRVMPSAEHPLSKRPMPWDVWPYEPAIHLMLFVHRVDGLTPGLYFLARDPNKLNLIQRSMNPEINWVRAPGCSDDLPLYWLLEGDAKRLAIQVSCHQDIAGDSAFSLGMLAEFEGPLRDRGAWWYPRLFWESGLLGQVLYLEAEAAGVRATGIGCFFDDPVHEIVSIKGLSFQSLYHFTVGGPVEDRRLMTLPPYEYVKRGS